jgi:hypothetical protein
MGVGVNDGHEGKNPEFSLMWGGKLEAGFFAEAFLNIECRSFLNVEILKF